MATEGNVDTALALHHCRDITRRRARNFYYGLKLLPEPQRSALYAVYAWMRRADDLTDDPAGNRDGARRRLADFRDATECAILERSCDGDLVLLALCDTAKRFPIKVEHFRSMMDGQFDDLDDRSYDGFDDLHEYCYRVASTVGLICIDIWGYDDPRAPEPALDRGIAFQLTNIIRDFAEDYDRGRVYLPAEDFDRHGLDSSALRRWSDPERGRRFLLEQIDRAESYYESSRGLDRMIDRECLPTLWAMTAIYYRLLCRIRKRPSEVVSGRRVRLSAAEKGAIALKARLRSRGNRVTGGSDR